MHTSGARLGAFFVLAAAAAGCSNSPEPSDSNSRLRALASVFESSEPYTTRVLTDADLSAFFAKDTEYLADSARIARFYRDRGMQFAWILDNRMSSSAESFMTLAGLGEATRKSPQGARRLSSLYDQAVSDGQRVPLCDSCGREMELRLTAEFFRFAANNYGGYLNTEVHDLNWFIPRARKDFARLLDSLSEGKMDLSEYEAVHPQYKLLLPHLRSYAELAKLPWPTLTLPRKHRALHVGDSLPLVAELRRRLQLLGDFDGDTASFSYDSTLAAGVRAFQTRHGLKADGMIGERALAALNVTPAARMRTILINMERLRWVSPHQPPNLLLVNIPEFRLHVFESDSEVMTMNVVVGARATRTVTFTDTLTQIVFSPSWAVPRSIVQKEILPAMATDPTYLERNDMEIVGGSEEEPEIRQRPGPRNALGRVKFLFPNSYNIYMHDTPAKGLFAGEDRAASHGCIRLSDAKGLAEYLLRNDPEWTPERIHEAMMSGREKFVKLTDRRPVAIVYFTAWVDKHGALNFRDDVYGHDRELAAEIFASATGRRAQPAKATSTS